MAQKVYYDEQTTHVSMRMPVSIEGCVAKIAHESRRSRGAQIVKMIEEHPDYQAYLAKDQLAVKTA